MERIKVYNIKKRLSYSLIIFGGILLILGGGRFFITEMTESNFSKWNALTFGTQGCLFMLIGYWNLRSGKYYIEWDDEKINFLLPKSKGLESIIITDITGVDINLFEINLKFENAEKTINLDNLQFEEIRKTKEKFGEIKRLAK